MRIERHVEDRLGHVALLDPIEARVLGRSAEAIPAWMAERAPDERGTLRWVGDSRSIAASFPDEGTLHAFVGRFLPGLLARMPTANALSA